MNCAQMKNFIEEKKEISAFKSAKVKVRIIAVFKIPSFLPQIYFLNNNKLSYTASELNNKKWSFASTFQEECVNNLPRPVSR